MRFQGITVSEISQVKSIYDILCGIFKKHTHTIKNSDIQRTDCYQRHSRGGGGNKELSG